MKDVYTLKVPSEDEVIMIYTGDFPLGEGRKPKFATDDDIEKIREIFQKKRITKRLL